MKQRFVKLLLLLSVLVPVVIIGVAKDQQRSTPCNTRVQEAADVIRSSGCGKKSKCFCTLSACALAVKGSLIVNGTFTVDGVDLSSVSNRATDVFDTGLFAAPLGYAEYIYDTTAGAQTRAQFELFDFPIQLSDTIGLNPVQVSGSHTVFTLQQGTYIIDYATAFAFLFGPTIFNIVIMTGPNNIVVPSTPNSNSYAGSNFGNWIHGRLVLEVDSAGLAFGIAPGSPGGGSVQSGFSAIVLTVVKIK